MIYSYLEVGAGSNARLSRMYVSVARNNDALKDRPLVILPTCRRKTILRAETRWHRWSLVDLEDMLL